MTPINDRGHRRKQPQPWRQLVVLLLSALAAPAHAKLQCHPVQALLATGDLDAAEAQVLPKGEHGSGAAADQGADPQCALLIAEHLLADANTVAPSTAVLARARRAIRHAVEFADPQQHRFYLRILFHQVAYAPDLDPSLVQQLRIRNPKLAQEADQRRKGWEGVSSVTGGDGSSASSQQGGAPSADATTTVTMPKGSRRSDMDFPLEMACGNVFEAIQDDNIKSAEVLLSPNNPRPVDPKCSILLAEYLEPHVEQPEVRARIERLIRRAAEFADPRDRDAYVRMLYLKIAYLVDDPPGKAFAELKRADPARAKEAASIRSAKQMARLRPYFEDPTDNCPDTDDPVLAATQQWRDYRTICDAVRRWAELGSSGINDYSYYTQVHAALAPTEQAYPVMLGDGQPRVQLPEWIAGQMQLAKCMASVEAKLAVGLPGPGADPAQRVAVLAPLVAQLDACGDAARSEDRYGLTAQFNAARDEERQFGRLLDEKAKLEQEIADTLSGRMPNLREYNRWLQQRREIYDQTRYKLLPAQEEVLAALSEYVACKTLPRPLRIDLGFTGTPCARFIELVPKVAFGQTVLQQASRKVRQDIDATVTGVMAEIRDFLYNGTGNAQRVSDLGAELRFGLSDLLSADNQYLLEQLTHYDTIRKLSSETSRTRGEESRLYEAIVLLDPRIARRFGWQDVQQQLIDQGHPDAARNRVTSAFKAINQDLQKGPDESVFTETVEQALLDQLVTPCIGNSQLVRPIQPTTTWYRAAFGNCRAWHGDLNNAIDNFERGWKAAGANQPDLQNQFLALMRDVAEQVGGDPADVPAMLKDAGIRTAYASWVQEQAFAPVQVQKQGVPSPPSAPPETLPQSAAPMPVAAAADMTSLPWRQRDTLPFFAALKTEYDSGLKDAFDAFFEANPRLELAFTYWDYRLSDDRAGGRASGEQLDSGVKALINDLVRVARLNDLEALRDKPEFNAAILGVQQTLGMGYGLFAVRLLEARRAVEIGCLKEALGRLAGVPQEQLRSKDGVVDAAGIDVAKVFLDTLADRLKRQAIAVKACR